MSERVPPLSIHAWLRYDTIERLLPRDARTLLEIGAGQGSAGALLARRFSYVGLEPDPQSFETAARRVGELGKVLNQPLETYEPAEPFDLVCAFEVLEHIEDDRAALVRWQQHLRPGGRMLVSVPARPDHFGPSDVKVGHYRRYDRRGLEAVLAAAGLLDIEVLTYGFPIGYVLEAGRNILARRLSKETSLEDRTAASGRWLQPPDQLAPLMRIASFPFRLAQRPFGKSSLGTGLVARAQRPASSETV